MEHKILNIEGSVNTTTKNTQDGKAGTEQCVCNENMEIFIVKQIKQQRVIMKLLQSVNLQTKSADV